MEAEDFEILLIDATFYSSHIQNLIFNELINNEKI